MTQYSRIFLASISLVAFVGCGQVLGLNEFDLEEGDGDGAGGSGDTRGDGGQDGGGGSDASGGSDSGGSGGSDSGGSGGATGVGGDPGTGGNGTGGSDPEVDCIENIDCDDENDCTTDSCVDEECVSVTVGEGEACSGGVCNGVSGESECVRCLDTAGGSAQDLGCPAGAPQCNTNGVATCVGCTSSLACNDNNDCTADACSTGTCQYTTEATGDACNGGVCNGTQGSESCELCVDNVSWPSRDAGCGPSAPVCDTLGSATCIKCLDDAAGATMDSGCTAGLPMCSGSACLQCVNDAAGTATDTGCSSGSPMCVGGACTQCQVNSDCAEDGHACSAQTCNSGTCNIAYDNTKCAEYGDVCFKNVQCTSSGCTSESDSAVVDLLNGQGSFETNGDWLAPPATDLALVIKAPHSGAAHGGTKVAQMTYGANQYHNLYQVLTLPAGLQSITVSGYYKSFLTGTDHSNDYLLVGYYNGANIVDAALKTGGSGAGPYDSPTVTAWTFFTSTTLEQDLDEYPSTGSGEVEIDLVGYTNGGGNVRYFAVDDVRVDALICPAP